VFDFDRDLTRTKTRARQRELNTDRVEVFGSADVDPRSLKRALALVEDVAESEFDRETNLNARATAVASVAGVIIALSAAFAKTVYGATDWTDVTKLIAMALFIVAMFCLTLSIFFTVTRVLRPSRGPRTKSFLGETIVELWNDGVAHDLVRADADQLLLVRFDRTVRTLPEWHIRNRLKARWIRRAWMFLAYGIVAIASASVFVVGELLDIPPTDENGVATDVAWWHVAVFLALLAVLAGAALKFDWVRAGRAGDDDGTVAELVAGLDELRGEVATPRPARG
jgi:hypothetical protein